ncbi:MAG: hypothetical protein MI921_30040 [Cytophagales bacterium]|nr:hypothetical protein [Cytophagales bacterium]
MLQNINQPILAILGFIAMVLIGIIAFFLRNLYLEHKEAIRNSKDALHATDHLQKKYEDLKAHAKEQDDLQTQIIKVENESKLYWETLKTTMEKQYELLLEKVENTNQYVKMLLENFNKTN